MDILGYFGVTGTKKNNTTNCTIAERYAPKQIEEFLDNYKQIREFHDWFTNGKSQHLLIVGPTGCGKTTLVEMFCKTYNKTIYTQNSFHKRNKTELLKFYNNIKHYIEYGIFLFDDIEALLNKCESVSIAEIAKWRTEEQKPTIRTIYVCNSTYLKKITALSAVCKTIYMAYPSEKNMFAKCLQISEQENIDLSGADMIRLKQIIDDLKEPRMIINSLNMIQCVDTQKDVYLDMYDIFRIMLNPSEGLDKKFRYFATESGTIPIIMQENYIDLYSDLSDIDLYQVSDSMSQGDIYHKDIFVNNNSMQVSVYACLSSIFFSIQAIPNIANYKIYKSPRFGLLWTKQSAMYQKRKYWSRFEEHVCLPHMNLNNNLSRGYINDVYKHLFSNHKTQKASLLEFSNFYNIDTKANSEIAFNLYNSFNINIAGVDEKTLTKKAFLTSFNKLN